MISNRWRSKLRKVVCKSAPYNVTVYCLTASGDIIDVRLGSKMLKGLRLNDCCESVGYSCWLENMAQHRHIMQALEKVAGNRHLAIRTNIRVRRYTNVKRNNAWTLQYQFKS